MDDVARETLDEIVLHARRAVDLRTRLGAPIKTEDWQSLYLASHLILIIGELSMRLRDHHADTLNDIKLPWFQIIATRHIVAHNYEAIDPMRIDHILTDKLPELIRTIDIFLDDLS